MTHQRDYVDEFMTRRFGANCIESYGRTCDNNIVRVYSGHGQKMLVECECGEYPAVKRFTVYTFHEVQKGESNGR